MKRCSNLKNKRSSRLSQLNSWNETCFLKAWTCFKSCCRQKVSSWSIQIERKNLAHKERFCSKSTNSMKDSRHEKPACYYIFHYLNKINKFNMPGSRQLHTVLLISTTFYLKKTSTALLCIYKDPGAEFQRIRFCNLSLKSDFFSWISLTLFKTKWLADICSNCWQISATYFAQSLWPLCEKYAKSACFLTIKKTTAN